MISFVFSLLSLYPYMRKTTVEFTCGVRFSVQRRTSVRRRLPAEAGSSTLKRAPLRGYWIEK
jgi:hypothetical protein